MDSVVSKIKTLAGKYGYAAAILLLGLILVLLPGKDDTEEVEQTTNISESQPDIVEQLADILREIDGVGEVKVLVSIAQGPLTVYQTDENTGSGELPSVNSDTVTVTDSSRNETALIRQTIAPVYQGAVVVCQGADSALVRLSVIEAVANITGLGTDRITVLKMK